MNILWLVALKEMRHGLNSQFAYLLFLVFVVSPAIPLFWSATHHNVILSGQADLQAFFGMLPLMLIVFVPALVMRVWAEERRSGTLEILMSLPLDEGHLVLGKFLGNLILCGGCLAGTWVFPVLVAAMGPLDWGPVIGGYFGAFLLSAACLAICTFAGSLTHSQITAFILGFLMLAALMFLPLPAFNLHSRFVNTARGVLDSRDICFYLIVTALFLCLNTQFLKLKR